jgi:ribonuclease BN (tRNA processing enzyme)
MTIFTNHPGICYGYRLEWDGRSLVYLSDTEPYQFVHKLMPDDEAIARTDARLVSFVRGADLLIADAQFDAREYRDKRGWGHSSVDDAVRLALEAGVKHLALFHHDPSHDDDKVDALLAHARQLIKRKRSKVECLAAQEGLEVLL